MRKSKGEAMTDSSHDYDHLASRLREDGCDVDAVAAALAALVIETPSWGFGDSGTRFGVFPQAGRPRDVFERFDDAAEVHRLTGTASAVATHFPWDAVDDLGALRDHAAELRLSFGAVNPNVFQDPDYKLGSVGNPDPAIRAKAVEALIECVGSPPRSARPRSRCGSPTAPTTPVRTASRSATSASLGA